MGDKAAETGLQCGDAGVNRDLGSRSREAIQRVQDGRWRRSGMDASLARRSKTRTRMENWVQIAVQLGQRMLDGRGSRETEGEGEGYRKQSNGETGIIDKT